MHSRRGSTVVEATMVLPLLILSVLTCLLVCMFFYDTTIRQCQLHQSLRWEADDLTGNTTCLQRSEDEEKNNSITVSRSGVFQTISGKEHTTMIHQGILHSRVSEDTESIWHAADGVTYVRYCIMGKSIKDEK